MRLAPRIGERNHVRRSEPGFCDLAGEGEAVNPFSGAARRDNEIKPGAVAIAPGFVVAAARAVSFCIPPAMVAIRSYNWSYNSTRIVADNGGRGKTEFAKKLSKTKNLANNPKPAWIMVRRTPSPPSA